MKYVCEACGWVYDEEVGAPELDIAPGTKFEDLPDDFVPSAAQINQCSLPKTKPIFGKTQNTVFQNKIKRLTQGR